MRESHLNDKGNKRDVTVSSPKLRYCHPPTFSVLFFTSFLLLENCTFNRPYSICQRDCIRFCKSIMYPKSNGHRLEPKNLLWTRSPTKDQRLPCEIHTKERDPTSSPSNFYIDCPVVIWRNTVCVFYSFSLSLTSSLSLSFSSRFKEYIFLCV